MNPIFQKHHIKSIATDNFVMNPVELKDYIDFDVKRIYYITEPKKDAGGHCHKQEKELFILVQGSCTAQIDRGKGLEDVFMKANDAIYVDAYVWHYFKNLSSNAILLALSSTNYNPSRSDYIEDYEEYKKVVQQ
ncbi:MAG: sugar 3,4-ketoisomerase [Patescibacteria group bacterium]